MSATSKPPLTGAHHPLPLDALSPLQFETLCLWLVLREGYEDAEHIGQSGNEKGRDVVAWKDGRRHAFQCKRVQSFGAADGKTEIDKIRSLPAGRQPAVVTFVVSRAVSDEARWAIREKWGDEETCRFWSGTELDERIKRHPDLLEEFFQLPPQREVEEEGLRVSISHLPIAGETFVAREDELALLDAAWSDGTNVVSFVAMGGAGKSALVNAWLNRVQRDGWRGAERVLGWSFYSQGTKETSASSENFTDYALGWFGYQGEPITSAWTKGAELVRLVRKRRTLLVLDGLEPLQDPHGKVVDPAVQTLLRDLTAANPGLCVVTTRVPIKDLAGKAGAKEEDLEKLPPEAGAELLRRLGCHGSEKELRKASEEYGGHGLALTLLGTYLRDVYEGDVRRRGEIHVLDETVAAKIEGSEHARRMLAAYEKQLDEKEVRVLRLLGLFDRPADVAAVAALRAAPEVAGLTKGIGASEETAWRLALVRLRKARLVAKDDGSGTLDAHPLVREHFAERLQVGHSEAWREGNDRLYEHYRLVPKDLPDTLEEMLPLYAAVVHGCRAGRVQDALVEVYLRRIQRGNEFYSRDKLGAFGAELTALAAFFEQPWARPSEGLPEEARAWLLNEAGSVLRALGRLREAVEPLRAGLEFRIRQEDWENAARSASNLSELTLTLGEVSQSVAAGEESVELADRSGDAFCRMASRTKVADALHQAGRREESAAAFAAAETMQAEWQPHYPRLYSVQGYRYCDLLLGRTEPEDGSGLDGVVGDAGLGEGYWETCRQVEERASQTLGWAEIHLGLLDVALDHLSLGRAHLGLALAAGASSPDREAAAGHLDRAVEGLRQAGVDEMLVRGLLARAAFRRLTGDLAEAEADLAEAEEIAERGSMRLFLTDAHLERARLLLFQKHDPAAARAHVEAARTLVEETGYGRRRREVEFLEQRLGEGSS